MQVTSRPVTWARVAIVGVVCLVGYSTGDLLSSRGSSDKGRPALQPGGTVPPTVIRTGTDSTLSLHAITRDPSIIAIVVADCSPAAGEIEKWRGLSDREGTRFRFHLLSGEPLPADTLSSPAVMAFRPQTNLVCEKGCLDALGVYGGITVFVSQGDHLVRFAAFGSTAIAELEQWLETEESWVQLRD